MSSTRARKERTIQDRVSESLTEGDKSLIADLKRFSDDSGSESGNAGESTNNSPTSPAGNYLARKGDTMLGAFALSPPLDFTIDIDANNTINISPLNGNPQYSSNIQLEDVPTSTTLDIIAGATFDGQILILRTFAPNPITISQATLTNGGNIQTPDSNDVILGDLQMVVLVFDEALVINENTGGTWRLLNTFGTGVITTDASVATLALQSSIDLLPTVPVDFNNNIILGTGIIDRTDDNSGVFQLSGGIFQINSSISISQADPQIGAGEAEWKRADNVNMGSSTNVGTKSRVYNSKSNANFSSTPMDAFTIDATNEDVFVQLTITSSTGSNPQLEKIGTWAQIFSIGGGNGGGDGDISFPIRPPVTTGLPTTGNVILELNQTSGHYFTIGPLTGDIDINITNPPAANTAQAFRINIIKGATDFTVTFNDTLLVQPFIGEENTTTLLAGDIYDATTFNIFTMTSTAGSGTPTEQWATFPAVDDVDFATFDGVNVDRFLFALDSTTFSSGSDVGFVRSTGGLIANVGTQQGHFWRANLQSIMSVSQEVTSNNTILDVVAPAIDGAVPNIRTFALDTTPTVGTSISRMEFIAQNNNAENIAYAGLQTDIEGIVNSLEEGSLSLIARAGGSFVSFMSMNDSADGNITAFRDIHMDTGRNIELATNRIYTNITSDNTFMKGDATSIQFFIADASSTKITFGTTTLLLKNDYFLQTQLVQLRGSGITSAGIDGSIWYNSDTDQILGQLDSGVVDLGASGGVTNSISQLNSNVTVTDTGSGIVSINVDGATAQQFRVQAARIDVAKIPVFGFSALTFDNNSATSIFTQENAIFDINFPSGGTTAVLSLNVRFNSVIAFSVDTVKTQIYSITPNVSPAALFLFRDDPSPVSSPADKVGEIQFRGRDLAATNVPYGKIAVQIEDAAAATATGAFQWTLRNNGQDQDMMSLLDGVLGISRILPTDAIPGAALVLNRADTGAAIGDRAGTLAFAIDAGTELNFGRLSVTWDNTTGGDDSSRMDFELLTDDNLQTVFTIKGSAITDNLASIEVSGESYIKAQSGVIGFFVTADPNITDSGIIGTQGTLQIPVIASLTPSLSNFNAAFGNFVGAMGVFNTSSANVNIAWKSRSDEWVVIAIPGGGGNVLGDHFN